MFGACRDLPGREIAALRKSGVAVTEEAVTPEVAVTGDTTIRGILSSPDALNARILVTEMTFLDDSVRAN